MRRLSFMNGIPVVGAINSVLFGGALPRIEGRRKLLVSLNPAEKDKVTTPISNPHFEYRSTV